MACCWKPKTSSPPKPSDSPAKIHKEETILRIPGAAAHLIEDGEAIELGKGDLLAFRITEEGVPLATAIKIGSNLQWPLTRDEPVVKLDELHYLFSLPDKEGGFLNYGVSFAGPDNERLASFDSFLKENACFSTPSKASSIPKLSPRGADWSEYAPRVDDYAGLLAKAIAGGTGQIAKGIFRCSDAYATQVQKAADMIQSKDTNTSTRKIAIDRRADANRKRGAINKTIRRVRKLSEMTETISRSLLNGVISVTGTVTTPMVRSKTGQAVVATFPGQVLLASLDAVNKVLDAVEAAERKSLAATGGALAGMVSQKFGENAGEATEDVFATAGHTVGTAWNLFKIRKAITPSSSMSSSLLKNAVKRKV